MSNRIEFTVHGEPRPKGSKNAFVVNFPYGKDKSKVAIRIRALANSLLKNPFGWRPITTVSEVSKDLPKWEKRVKETAKTVMAAIPQAWSKETPVRLIMLFYLKRPGYHYGTGRNKDVIKPQYKKAYPLKVPDLSKLFRAAEDGLNEVVFHDDCNVVDLAAKKRFGRKNGVMIIAEKMTVEEIADMDAEQMLLFDEKEL
jgi:Holliday junction resolvase RusA-like endonuclease